MKIEINLTSDVEEKIKDYAKIMRISIEDTMKRLLLSWLSTTEKKFQDVGHCPNCRLNGTTTELKGMPIVSAEGEGLVAIDGDRLRKDLADDGTYYAVCPKCMWFGFPVKGKF